MQAIGKRLAFYLAVSALYAFVCATIMGLVAASVLGPGWGLRVALEVGLTPLVVIFLAGCIHCVTVSALPFGVSDETLAVRHVRTVRLDVPLEEAFSRCKSALGLVRRHRIRKQDLSGGVLVARTGMTWKSWGDIIRFTLRQDGGGLTVVEVSSRPLLPTTIVDQGENLQIVEKISASLRASTGT